MSASQGQPGHRRGAVVEARVLEAVTSLLGDVGYGFTFEEVARRARVHKTTVYRHWGSKPRLVVAALERFAAETIDLPPGDDPVADLFELSRRVARTLGSAQGGTTIRALVAAAADDPELVETAERFLTRRYEHAVAIIRAGQRMGQLRADLDPVLTWQSIVNPLHMRVILGDPADEATATELVEQVLTGAYAAASTRHR